MRFLFHKLCILLTFCFLYACSFSGIAEYYSITECDENYLLTPVVDVDIEYKVLVQNLLSVPQPLLSVDVSFTKTKCNGETFEVYFKNEITNFDGIVEGTVPFHFRWTNDSGEWQVHIGETNYNFAGYVQTFDFNTNTLYAVISISDLED